MLVRDVTLSELDTALDKVNKNFEGNVIWNRAPEYAGRTRRGGEKYNLTLRVIDSKGPGARRGYTGRRLVSACWHVHGEFFDAVLEIAPDAEIVVAGASGKEKINWWGGNWRDRNIGSMYRPMYFSEACEC